MKGFYSSLSQTVCLLLLCCTLLGAQNRPTVGVALSGGSAKGLAHIGVLKVLEEINMPVDYITGTSMGSIIGGLYASGYTAAELESLVTTIDWGVIFTEETSREELSLEQKRRDARYAISFALRGLSIGLPSGLVAGHKITQLLTRLTLPVQHIEEFADFPIPFACVATNIATGEAVVLKDGSLAEAMRASMAIPSAFTAVDWEGKLLVDGLLVRNFPVEDVRALGADIVIGVDVGAPLYEKEQINSFLTVIDQVLNLQMINSTEMQRQMCDFLLLPELDDLSIVEFNKIAEFIQRGEAATREILPELQALADSLNRLDPRIPPASPAVPKRFLITEIGFDSLAHVPPGLLRKQFPHKLPISLSIKEIENYVDRIYNNQVFERVSYRLINAASGRGARLQIHAIERSQNLLQVGFRYDTRNDAAVLLNTTFYSLLTEASTLTVDARLGSSLRFESEYYQSIALLPGLGLNLSANYRQEKLDVFDKDNRIARLDLDYSYGELFIGSNYSTRLLLGGGVRAEYVNSNRSIGDGQIPDRIDKGIVAFATFGWDNWDRSVFPRRGINTRILSEFTADAVNNRGTYSRYYWDWQALVPLSRRLSLMHALYAGTSFGDDLPPHFRFTLGGVDVPMTRLGREASFLGLKNQQLSGEHVQMFQIGMQYELLSRRYAQVLFNVGRALEEWTFSLDPDRYSFGGGVLLGADTPLGPLDILFHSSGDNFMTHLNVGFKF